MKSIRNKRIAVQGAVFYAGTGVMEHEKLECIITNDKHGKTLSINDGIVQFTIPFEPIERYLK